MAVAAAAVAESTAVELIALSSSCMLVCSAGWVVAACDMARAQSESMCESGYPRFRRFNPTTRADCISTTNCMTSIRTTDSCISLRNSISYALNYLWWDGLYFYLICTLETSRIQGTFGKGC